MRATVDKAGRLVLPKPLRDRVGLGPGEVEVFADGAGLRIEAIAADDLDEVGGRLIVPASGIAVDDELIRGLRHVDQR